MVFIWLKAGVEGKLEKLKKDGHLGSEIQLETRRNSGKKFISIYGDPFDPTIDIPEIPEELIEKVTLKDRIHCGFRTEGVYCRNGATVLVRSESRVHSEMMMQGPIETERWQEISVSAPTVQAVKEIYTMVREGLLPPEKSWGSFPDAPAPAPVD